MLTLLLIIIRPGNIIIRVVKIPKYASKILTRLLQTEVTTNVSENRLLTCFIKYVQYFLVVAANVF